MSRVRLLCVLPGLITALSRGAFAATEVPQGTYVADHDQHTEIEAAIEASISAMNVMIRSIARRRLRDDNVEYGLIRIARSAANIEITFENGKPMHLPTDGTAVKWTNEHNDDSTVTLKEVEGQLIQTYQGSGGVRINTFRWDAPTCRLLLDVRTSSPRLPQPVTYTLVYRPGS